MNPTQSRFFMIDNIFIRAYSAFYSGEEVLLLLPLPDFLSGILDSICKYVLLTFKSSPGCLKFCIRSVEQISGGCGVEKYSLNQTRF